VALELAGAFEGEGAFQGRQEEGKAAEAATAVATWTGSVMVP
jgi:hypothetical protein